MKHAMTGILRPLAKSLGLVLAVALSTAPVLSADESVREKDAATIKTF